MAMQSTAPLECRHPLQTPTGQLTHTRATTHPVSLASCGPTAATHGCSAQTSSHKPDQSGIILAVQHLLGGFPIVRYPHEVFTFDRSIGIDRAGWLPEGRRASSSPSPSPFRRNYHRRTGSRHARPEIRYSGSVALRLCCTTSIRFSFIMNRNLGCGSFRK